MTEQASVLAAPAAAAAGEGKWAVAWLLCAAHAVSFIDRFVMVLVTEPVRAALALSDTQLGLLQGTGFALFYCGFAIPLGWAADITNRRNLIIAGLSVWSIATAASAFATSFEALFAARIFVGMGEGCLIPAGMSLLTAYFSREQLARGVSIFGAGANIGHGVAFIGGGALLSWLTVRGGLALPGLPVLAPWQATFLVAGLCAFPVLIMLRSLREPKRSQTATSIGEHARAFGDAIAYLGRNFSAYGSFFVVASATATMGYALMSWSSSILVRMHGLPVAQAGMWVGILGIVGGPLGSLAGGWILDVMTKARITAAPLVYMAGGAVLCLGLVSGFCFAQRFEVSAACLFAFCFCTTGMLPAIYVGMQVLTPDSFRGIAASVNMMLYTLAGLGIGPTLVGLLSDRLHAMQGSIGIALVAAEAVLAAIVIVTTLLARRAFQAKVLPG